MAKTRTKTKEDLVEARLRVQEAGEDADALDDEAALARADALQAVSQREAIDDLIRRHSRGVIGAKKPEELTDDERLDAVRDIGEDEFIRAHLGKDSGTKLTPKDRAEFERISGHDAVIEAVLDRPISDFSDLELARARSALRNQAFEERIAGRRRGEDSDPDPEPDEATPPGPGGSGSGSGEGSDPGGGDAGTPPVDGVPGGPGGGGSGDGVGADGPEPPPPDGGPPPDEAHSDDVTGGSDGPGDAPPDDQPADDEPHDDDVISGSDDPEDPPPGGDGDGDGGGGGGGGSSTPSDSTPPADDEEDSDDGGFDYYGPTNPSGESGEYHRDDDGTWTDENGDEVTDPDTVASLEHEYEEYQEAVEDQPEEEPEPEPDDDEPDDDEEGPEGGSGVETTPADDNPPLPDDLREQLERDFADLRALQPRPGGGDTDPADDSGFDVRDPSVRLPSHEELGQSLFGQPPLDVHEGGGGGSFNPGADSQGGGVIDPSDDADASFEGPQRDDDPFDRPPPIEPAAEAEEPPPDDDDAVSFLPPRIAARVDDGPDLPDDLIVGDPD